MRLLVNEIQKPNVAHSPQHAGRGSGARRSAGHHVVGPQGIKGRGGVGAEENKEDEHERNEYKEEKLKGLSRRRSRTKTRSKAHTEEYSITNKLLTLGFAEHSKACLAHPC